MLTEEQINHLRKFAPPSRETGYTRSIYSYPAKFLSSLPHELIKTFTSPNELICDPFVGGGTTGLEAMLLNRRFVGYDINPFALLISRVKTKYISKEKLEIKLEDLLKLVKNFKKPINDYLDSIDKECLGESISTEINLLATIINTTSFSLQFQDFFNLALIHVTKIVGRRDFEQRKDFQTISLIPMFIRKCKKMIEGVSSLPSSVKYPPELILSSNHRMDIPNDKVDFILTSPPYIEVDVEYQHIQIQRRSINKSKRTQFISNLLQTESLSKKELCWTGQGGNVYWNNLEASLSECSRILKPNHFLCLWTGYKKKENQERLLNLFEKLAFTLEESIPIPQSDNRAASSRSTHHPRETKMFKQDSIFILRNKLS